MGRLVRRAPALVAGALVAFTYLTNPFTRLTLVRPTFRAHVTAAGTTVTDRNDRLVVRRGPHWRALALAACGLNVLGSRYLHSPRSRASTVDGVVADIHALRFDPDKLLLISGDHFSALFVRNLGVFYYPMLDRAVPGPDWREREAVYLQTVGFALGAFERHELTTTVVPVGPRSVVCVNIYALPSDSLYGILFALAALRGDEPGRPAPYGADVHRPHTRAAAEDLLRRHGPRLAHHYRAYRAAVLDERTGLVTTRRHLSGAKDITRRRSALYDNVVLWKTSRLAAALGLVDPDEEFDNALRERVLERFWLPAEGHFLEDLSPEALAGRYYSSDWLIVLSTGFLDPADPRDRAYYERAVAHVRATGVAEPFAIRYQAETRAARQFPVVRLAVPSYGGDAIWSFWGMEYVKVLVLLHRATGDRTHLDEAGRHLAAYEAAMVENGGFPEVYGTDGAMLTTALYRSIRQTGWVIGFEQAREMYRAARRSAAPTGPPP